MLLWLAQCLCNTSEPHLALEELDAAPEVVAGSRRRSESQTDQTEPDSNQAQVDNRNGNGNQADKQNGDRLEANANLDEAGIGCVLLRLLLRFLAGVPSLGDVASNEVELAEWRERTDAPHKALWVFHDLVLAEPELLRAAVDCVELAKPKALREAADCVELAKPDTDLCTISNESSHTLDMANEKSSDSTNSIHSNDSVVYVVGDSHIVAQAFASLSLTSGKSILVPKLVRSLEAWHTSARCAATAQRHCAERTLTLLPRGSRVLFVAGEIDCRAGSGIDRATKHGHYSNEAEAVQRTANDYVDFLAQQAQKNELQIMIGNYSLLLSLIFFFRNFFSHKSCFCFILFVFQIREQSLFDRFDF